PQDHRSRARPVKSTLDINTEPSVAYSPTLPCPCLGDFHAVHEMTDGLAALNSSFEVAYASQASDGQYRENMIMLGGTEVNSLTSTILDKTGSTFFIDNDAMTLTDTRSPVTYGTEWDIDSLDGSSQRDFDHSWFISTDAEGTRVARRFRTDYGIMIRSRSPVAPKRGLVLICGVYGFGTWAGARLPFDKDFLREIRGFDSFECLFRVQVHQRQPLKTDILVLRALPSVPAPSSGLSSLRRRASRSGSRRPYEPLGSRLPATGDGQSGG
uniref:hypothetical protein n=1 Tax=Actinoplanes subtropicus TaxID=543632 RepID=UPI001B8033F4